MAKLSYIRVLVYVNRKVYITKSTICTVVKMEIQDTEINWMEGYLNDPYLKVLVDEKPELTGQEIWESYDDSLFLTEKEGYVWFFANPNSNGGLSYGNVTTEDGKEFNASGCWSSRAGCINSRDFSVEVVDVSITDSKGVMERGYTFTGGAITVEKAREAMEYVEDCVGLEKTYKYESDEKVYIPSRE